MRDLFTPSMAGLGLRNFQVESLVEEELPELFGHFASQGVVTSMYASSWFLTLFTTTLPLPLAARVMDIFLLDGTEGLFRIALALLSLAQPTLLSLDMEGVLKVTPQPHPTPPTP
jgi:hypothetical protein